MPKNLFQEVIFTIMMAAVMVYAMVCYNIALNVGGMTNEVFVMAFAEFPIMLGVAFVFDIFVVGHIAKKLTFRLFNPRSDKPLFIIIGISVFSVCFMCPLMSLVACLLFKEITPDFFATWVQTTFMNFPVAFFWQLIVAGPLVRLIFRSIFERKAKNKVSEKAVTATEMTTAQPETVADVNAINESAATTDEKNE